MNGLERVTACWLESERLALEPLRREYASELAVVLNDMSLHRFIGGQPEDAEALGARFDRYAPGCSPDGLEDWVNWTIRTRSTGQAVETIQATMSRSERQAVAALA